MVPKGGGQILRTSLSGEVNRFALIVSAPNAKTWTSNPTFNRTGSRSGLSGDSQRETLGSTTLEFFQPPDLSWKVHF